MVCFFVSANLDKTKCVVIKEGNLATKSIGDIWISENDLCVKHTCELDQNGFAVESIFREYCNHQCEQVNMNNFPKSLELNISLTIMH